MFRLFPYLISTDAFGQNDDLPDLNQLDYDLPRAYRNTDDGGSSTDTSDGTDNWEARYKGANKLISKLQDQLKDARKQLESLESDAQEQKSNAQSYQSQLEEARKMLKQVESERNSFKKEAEAAKIQAEQVNLFNSVQNEYPALSQFAGDKSRLIKNLADFDSDVDAYKEYLQELGQSLAPVEQPNAAQEDDDINEQESDLNSSEPDEEVQINRRQMTTPRTGGQAPDMSQFNSMTEEQIIDQLMSRENTPEQTRQLERLLLDDTRWN